MERNVVMYCRIPIIHEENDYSFEKQKKCLEEYKMIHEYSIKKIYNISKVNFRIHKI